MKSEIIHLPLAIPLEVRHNFDDTSQKAVVIFSSGYGNDGFSELAQLVIIKLFEKYGISSVQYVYPERSKLSLLDDLYISTGVATLMQVYDWVRERTSVPIILYGYSFGGNISLEVASIRTIESLLLVNCVFDYVEYRKQQMGYDRINEWKKSKLTYLSYGDDKYSLGYRFLIEAEQQNLETRAQEIGYHIYAFQAENDSIISTKYIYSLAKNNSKCTAHLICGPYADHSLEHPDALKELARLASPLVEEISCRM